MGKSIGREDLVWVIFDNLYNEWVITDTSIKFLRNTCAEWNEESLTEVNLTLVHSESLSWYDRTIQKLNRLNNGNKIENKIGLRLVG
jgi:hypothetical protein